MRKINRDKDEFNAYTSHYAKNDPETPYITLWVKTSIETIEDGDDSDEQFRWRGVDAETLDDYGVSIGPVLNKYNIGSSRALTEKHIGFFPKTKDLVYLVIEDYASGDSFGRTAHRYHPMKVFATYDDAYKWTLSEEGERCKHIDFFGGHNEYLIKEVHVR